MKQKLNPIQGEYVAAGNEHAGDIVLLAEPGGEIERTGAFERVKIGTGLGTLQMRLNGSIPKGTRFTFTLKVEKPT